MILLKRPKTETNCVQTYKVEGQTTCGLKLEFEGAVCFNSLNESELPSDEEISTLAKQQIEKGSNLTVASVDTARVHLRSMRFEATDLAEVIENRLRAYFTG